MDATTVQVTFLFSDVEASTRLLERFAARAGDALARHHALISETVIAHGGVVFERIGDAAYAAFAGTDHAPAAIGAAVELQSRLATEDWGEIPRLRVRLAIYTGEAEQRDDRYFGSALFRCSRMQDLASGGETLVAGATAALVSEGLPDGHRLRDLGSQRLKGLTEPEHVFQLVHTSRAPTAGEPPEPAGSAAEGTETVTDETAPIRVMLVDDHAVVRRGLRGFLELLRDIEVVGEAEDGRQAVALAERLTPDVVLMDLLMPNMTGLEAIAAIKQAHPEIEIVAVTSFIEEEKVTAALEAGASGYLLKDAEAEEVAQAIRAAYNGEVHIDAAVARLLAQRMRTRRDEEPVEPLTGREREVLAQLARGASNKEIAYDLSITERTARTHVSNILGKLGLASRTQAALWAVEHKMTEPS